MHHAPLAYPLGATLASNATPSTCVRRRQLSLDPLPSSSAALTSPPCLQACGSHAVDDACNRALVSQKPRRADLARYQFPPRSSKLLKRHGV